MGKLAVIELGVETSLFQQFLMLSLLHDMAIPHDQDHICLPEGGQPVGHDKGGTALHHGVEGLLDGCYFYGGAGGI